MSGEISYIRLPGFPKGVVSNLNNQADFPQDALAAGENVELTNGVRARGGSSITSSGSLPAGDVVFLKNVRFPTNESSYLLAQVNQAATSPPDIPITTTYTYGAALDFSMVWDSGRERAIQFGGFTTAVMTVNPSYPIHEVYASTASQQVWQTVAAAGTLPDGRFGHSAVYDATREQMIVFGGFTGGIDPMQNGWYAGGSSTAINELLYYDCATDTWLNLAATGTPPPARGYHTAIITPTTMIVWAGTSPSGTISQETVYCLDLASRVWSSHPTTGGPTGVRQRHSAVYDSANNTMIICGGMVDDLMSDTWKLNLNTWAWTSLADFPYVAQPYGHSAVYFNGKMLSLFGIQNIAELPNGLACYDISHDTWSPVQVNTSLRPRMFGVGVVSATGEVRHWGGYYDYDVLEWLEFPATIWNWAGTATSKPGTSTLWASDTHLPSGSAQFTQIYDLGENAGVISAAVLNDRCVITEGVNKPPLTWSGCMAAEASDWAYPTHVLITQDGNFFYAVDQQVLDKDTSNEAGIGGILPSGYIAICCDVPNVEAFYVEVATPNTQSAGSTNALSLPISFVNDTYLDQENFADNGLLPYDKWELDTGNYGYVLNPACSLSGAAVDNSPNGTKLPVTARNFSESLATWFKVSGTTNYNGYFLQDAYSDATHVNVSTAYIAETLGGSAEVRRVAFSEWDQRTTNEAEIQANLKFVTSTGTARIVGFHQVTPGSGNASNTQLEISSPLTSGDIEGIYGLQVSNGALSIFQQTSSDLVTGLDLSAHATTQSAGFASYNGFSVRQVVTGAEIGLTGDYINLTFAASDLTTLVKAVVTNSGLTVAAVSIVPRSGSTANGTTDPTPVTFNGGEAGFSIGAGASITSDTIHFPVSPSGSYLVIIDVAKGSPLTATYENVFTYWNGPTLSHGHNTVTLNYNPTGWISAAFGFGSGYYVSGLDVAGSGDAPASASLQTVTGYTDLTIGNCLIGLTKVEVAAVIGTPTGIFVATTNSKTVVDLGIANGFSGMTVSERIPGGAIYYAVSLDNNISFQVYTSGAWRTIAKNDGGTWKYNTSSTSTPAWTAATHNTKHCALRQAFGVSANVMSGSALAGITEAQWLSTNGIVLGVTPSLNVGIGLQASGSSAPVLQGITVNITSSGFTAVEGLTSSGWDRGAGWTDGTVVGGASLAQSGIISYDGANPFEADYANLSQVPGYWYRCRVGGTSAGTSITRVMYKAPCQPLQSIGDGQPSQCIGFIFVDSSEGTFTDFTVQVQDYVNTSLSYAAIPMHSDDYVYIGGVLKFSDVQFTMYMGNTVGAGATVEYWNGSSWKALTITDGTSYSGATLATSGLMTWSIPDDWRTCIPFNTFMSRGYWVRLSVSGTLSTGTGVGECRIYTVPDALKKYRFAEILSNRMTLACRPDAPDQIDISRPLEEYGFTGGQSASYRVGGVGSIFALIEAWGVLWAAKDEGWAKIQETSGGFDISSVEAARHLPINSRVIVKAPATNGGDDGNQYGLFFINRYGAFVQTGLNIETIYSTARNRIISASVSWWLDRPADYPRLDLNNLHLACGEYWPSRNWVIWSVPMLVTADQTEQLYNNRLIVYDLMLQTWLPPMKFPVGFASLATAYAYSATAPAKLGTLGLYAGDYQGRIIRLFDPSSTDDFGTAIAGFIETGWLHHGNPELEKDLREVWVYGHTAGDAVNLTVSSKLFRRTATVQPGDIVKSFTELATVSDLLGLGFIGGQSTRGNFLKYRADFTGATDLYGLQIGLAGQREVPAT